MNVGDVARGLAHSAERAIDRFIRQPRRRKAWAAMREPFDHQGARGRRFRLHPGEFVDSVIFMEGMYERRFLELLLRRFRSGTMLDIGANIGNHTIVLAEVFDRVHAFEPNPVVLDRLRYNVGINQLDSKVVIHPVGLGDTSGDFAFVQNDDGNLGGSGFVNPDEGSAVAGKKILRVENADDYIERLGLDRIDFIKIDVEGWEPSLFAGLVKTISRFRPIIAFEYHANVAPITDFQKIRATLPGYVLAEASHAPPHGMMQKLAWNTVHRGLPVLDVLESPEPRSYENILAFPNAEALAAFREHR
jgi:FkbM family methyltransferase